NKEKFWQSLAGTEDKAITKVTGPAIQKIATYPETFIGGLKLNNMPDGFYIIQHGQDKILCYNPMYKNLACTPLAAPLVQTKTQRPILGNAEQFYKDKPKDKADKEK